MVKTLTSFWAEVADALLSKQPHPTQLKSLVSRELSLTPGETEEFVYQLVKQLNERLCPPISNMELMLSDCCNMACAYCFESTLLKGRERKQHLMKAETIKKSVDLLFDYSGNAPQLMVTLFGGEPTLNVKGINTATEYIQRKAHHSGKEVDLHMTSNGLLFTPELVDYFAQNKIRVLLSIDGLAATHDMCRIDKSGRGTFQTVIEKMRLLKSRQPWIGVKMTVMPFAVARLFENVRGLYDLGVNQFLIGHATGVSWTQEQMHDYCRQLVKIRDWYKSAKHEDLRISEFDEVQGEAARFGCGASRTTLSVACNGEISGCSKILSLSSKQVVGKLGDVTYGLYNLARRMEQVSCATLHANCVREGIADEYQGGCFATNYDANNDLYQPSLAEHAFSLLKKEYAV